MPRVTIAVGPDADGPLLAGLLDGAAHRLDAAVYEVGPSYGWRLSAAARRGVRVRLLVDDHAGAGPRTGRGLDDAVAVRVTGGRVGHEAHLKLLVVDGTTVAVGTGNLIARDAPPPARGSAPVAGAPAPPRPGTREWWALVEDGPALAAAAGAVFSAAWRTGHAPTRRRAVPEVAPPVGAPTRVPPFTVEVAPRALTLRSGGAAVGALLERLAARPGARLLCTVPYVHTAVPAVRRLLDAMDAAAATGADVRLLLGHPAAPDDAARMASRRFAIRVMDGASWTTGHAKGMVAGPLALVSSANWSRAGLGGNLEVAMAVRDVAVAGHLAGVFDLDWEAARPLPAGG